jgi:RND superfamily putative drug exporter
MTEPRGWDGGRSQRRARAGAANLLSSGASVGFVVAVVQWGQGRGILGLAEKVPIERYVPMELFAIVFGLSLSPPP